jgi:hypothetical protein
MKKMYGYIVYSWLLVWIVLMGMIFTTSMISSSVAGVPATYAQTAQHHAAKAPAFVTCTLTGLTGAAQQENLLFCNTNGIAGVPDPTTDCCGSVYKQAIHLAQQKAIVVGYPLAVIQAVDWAGVAITYVTFSSGLHAEHYNPSNGIARIYTPYGQLLYSGT